ncbi:MAG: replication-associated recombination protein A [Planctomycetes bacterium]|nr:replication-associated recombination protein A [Planctomycetota bacterium]
MTLFEPVRAEPPPPRPLADRMRPRDLDEFLGQEHALGEGRALRAAILAGQAGSLILFGPPGVGKTTLARIVAEHSGREFVTFSAVLSGVAEVRRAMAEAEERLRREGRGTLLFVDEIHRFNKAQQDAFLPYVEAGSIVLVGATTENPSFSIVAPLLSRCRVVQLLPLPADAIERVIDRALSDAGRGLGARRLQLAAEARAALVLHCAGDARRALTVLEAAAATAIDGDTISAAGILEALQSRVLRHDRAGDAHFDLLSALHKSLRNSDVQAAVYWLTRFLESDADPIQAARRMVAMAAEDVGLADPMALQVAVSAMQAAHLLGLPEAKLPLTEAAIYLAAAPKSNSVVQAIEAASHEVRSGAERSVPLHLRNAPTRLMGEWGHGKGYQYAHDFPGGVAPMPCLPPELVRRRFYQPGERGFEKKIAERMEEAERLRNQP